MIDPKHGEDSISLLTHGKGCDKMVSYCRLRSLIFLRSLCWSCCSSAHAHIFTGKCRHYSIATRLASQASSGRAQESESGYRRMWPRCVWLWRFMCYCFNKSWFLVTNNGKDYPPFTFWINSRTKSWTCEYSLTTVSASIFMFLCITAVG